MSQCLNPDCLYQNPPATKFCDRCGNKLLLGERYRAVGNIGEGGFGRTFKAVDEHRLNTPCVIKQFIPQQQGSTGLQKATELFKQEAIHLRDLGKHPQIPDLLAFFEQEKRLYLIQEFIDGEDLLCELTARGRFSEQQVRELLTDLLPVLQFIHEQNVIHRDIKPDNIIRSRTGSVMLIDFGVSKQLGATVFTRMGTVTGTPGYAPPEQMQGIVFPASDLYSLGVTCIRLLTGCLLQEKNGRVVDELFDPMQMRWVWRSRGATVSDDLGQILDKLLQFKVAPRYQSATEVLQVLNQTSTTTRGTNFFTWFLAPRTPRPVVPPASRVSLISDGEVDYSRLRDLLATGLWKEADEETAKVMLRVVRREKEGWLDSDSIDKFPCADIRIIDKLWLDYSKGRFGFSVQQRIYNQVGKNWQKFGDRVGWRRKGDWLDYADLSFNINAPKAHLPVVWLEGGGRFGGVWFGGGRGASSLASRLIKCDL